MSRQQNNRLHGLSRLGLALCRYVWRKISILCRMIKQSLADRKASQSISVMSMFLPEQDLSVAITGTIMTMPGLPKVPAAEGIDVNDDGQITGLF